MVNIEDLKHSAGAASESRDLTATDNGVFSTHNAFAKSMQMARALTSSTLVPREYQGEQSLGNALIALEIAQRTGASPLMVMQNLYVVHGRPAWSAQFIIAALNSCGRFSPLRFELVGDQECFAWAEEKATGQRLEGPKVSVQMAKDEGWYQRNGSKWKTMPAVMLRYRAASFFGKLYAPDILMGMQTQEEIEDFIEVDADLPPTDARQAADELTAQAQELDMGYESSEEAPKQEPEWPQQIPDPETGELRWADSAGHFYDADLHAWSEKDDRPAVKADGAFRARRGTSAKQKQEAVPRAEPDPDQNDTNPFGGME